MEATRLGCRATTSLSQPILEGRILSGSTTPIKLLVFRLVKSTALYAHRRYLIILEATMDGKDLLYSLLDRSVFRNPDSTLDPISELIKCKEAFANFLMLVKWDFSATLTIPPDEYYGPQAAYKRLINWGRDIAKWYRRCQICYFSVLVVKVKDGPAHFHLLMKGHKKQITDGNLHLRPLGEFLNTDYWRREWFHRAIIELPETNEKVCRYFAENAFDLSVDTVIWNFSNRKLLSHYFGNRLWADLWRQYSVDK